MLSRWGDGGWGDEVRRCKQEDGQFGDDRIEGGEGDDTITGGTGRDTVTGGDGADMIDIRFWPFAAFMGLSATFLCLQFLLRVAAPFAAPSERPE